MRKVLVTSLVLLMFVIVALGQTSNGWQVIKLEDPMTGQVTWRAYSPRTYSLQGSIWAPFVILAFDTNGQYELVSLIFEFPIKNSEIVGLKYLTDSVSLSTYIRWDNLNPNYLILWRPYNESNYFLYLMDGKTYSIKPIIDNLMKYNTVTIQINLASYGLLYYKIPLTGSKEAINTARNNVKKKW